jgi:archaemetzincin
MKYVIIGIVAILTMYACQPNTQTASANKQLTIIIQPFIDFKPNEANAVMNEVKKYYGKVIVNKPINFPPNSLNPTHTRRRADAIIKYLSIHTPAGFRTIGLTHTDISVTKDDKPDWGVMGLGYCPGKSCVASTFRLHGNNRFEKLVKVALHELGHTEGLNHCPEKTCLLRDAEGKDHLNEEKGFCASCKKYLIKKGWELK